MNTVFLSEEVKDYVKKRTLQALDLDIQKAVHNAINKKIANMSDEDLSALVSKHLPRILEHQSISWDLSIIRPLLREHTEDYIDRINLKKLLPHDLKFPKETS